MRQYSFKDEVVGMFGFYGFALPGGWEGRVRRADKADMEDGALGVAHGRAVKSHTYCIGFARKLQRIDGKRTRQRTINFPVGWARKYKSETLAKNTEADGEIVRKKEKFRILICRNRLLAPRESGMMNLYGSIGALAQIPSAFQ